MFTNIIYKYLQTSIGRHGSAGFQRLIIEINLFWREVHRRRIKVAIARLQSGIVGIFLPNLIRIHNLYQVCLG